MNALTILFLFLMFTVLWLVLERIGRRQPKPDPRIQELLDHEQAAHDGFMRTLRRLRRLPE